MRQRSGLSILSWLSNALLALFALDRIVKLATVIHFFRRIPHLSRRSGRL
jgi:hypothetical protein